MLLAPILTESISYAIPLLFVYREGIDLSRVWDDSQFVSYPRTLPPIRNEDEMDLSLATPEELGRLKSTRSVQYVMSRPELITPIFSSNPHPEVVDFLIDHSRYLNWHYFSRNPNDKAVDYVLSHPLCIDWHHFSVNPHDRAVQYWIDHPDEIIWDWFSSNTSVKAVLYMFKYPLQVNWFILSQNPSIKVSIPDEALLKDWKTSLLA